MTLPPCTGMRTGVGMAFLFDLYRTLRFATRLPLPLLAREDEDPVVSADGFAPAFAMCGVLVGLIGGVVLSLTALLGASPTLASLLGVGSMILVTGALHEDGLADCADGIGGGRTRERKLDIMRDSAIGTYGVLALVLSVGTRVAALAAIVVISPWTALLVVIATQTLSRSAAMIPAALLDPARPDGAGARLGAPSLHAVIIANAAAGGVALAALCAGLGALAGFAGLLLAVTAIAVVVWLVIASAQRYIGGQTGDVLGATQQLTDLAGLVVLSISISIML